MPSWINSFQVGDGNFEVIQCGDDIVVVDAGSGNWKERNLPKSYKGLYGQLCRGGTNVDEDSGFYNLLRNTQKVHVHISHMHMDHINLLPHVFNAIDKENNRRGLGMHPIQLGHFVIGGDPSGDFYTRAENIFAGIVNTRNDITNNFQFSILCPNGKSRHILKKDQQWVSSDSNIGVFSFNLSGSGEVNVLGRGRLDDNARGIKNTFTVYAPSEIRKGGQNGNCNIGVLRRGKSGVIFWGDATPEIQKDTGLSDLSEVYSITQSHHGSPKNIYPYMYDAPLEVVVSTGRIDEDIAKLPHGKHDNRYHLTRDSVVTRRLGSKQHRAMRVYNRIINKDDVSIRLRRNICKMMHQARKMD